MAGGRNIIIGLDGVPYRMIKDLAGRGIMPNLKSLLKKKTLLQMESSLPEVSCVAWSSVITGANPAEHGVFGFTDFLPNTYDLYFPNFNDLKVKPFWNREPKQKHIIINVPSTYPAGPLNGVLISGFVSLDFKKAVYPAALIPALNKMGYNVDVDSEKAHTSMEDFLEDLFSNLESHIKAYRYLWKEKWDSFMFVVTGTDRLMHFLMDAYENVDHKYHAVFLDYFKKIDREIIGEILSNMDEADNLIMLSDHGFEVLEKDVYVNNILKENGFLERSVGEWGEIGDKTRAFALDPGRVYINWAGKYPSGRVSEKEKNGMLKELCLLFKNFKEKGEKVFRAIYKKEEIYHGPFFDKAPDLVLVGNKGFNLKASLKSKSVFSKGIFTGKHTQEDAFLIIDSSKKPKLSKPLVVSESLTDLGNGCAGWIAGYRNTNS